jgi:chromosome segregation ATPase
MEPYQWLYYWLAIVVLLLLGIWFGYRQLVKHANREHERVCKELENARARNESLAEDTLIIRKELQTVLAQTAAIQLPPEQPDHSLAELKHENGELKELLEKLTQDLADAKVKSVNSEIELKRFKTALVPPPIVHLAPEFDLAANTGTSQQEAEEIAKLQLELEEMRRRHSETLYALRTAQNQLGSNKAVAELKGELAKAHKIIQQLEWKNQINTEEGEQLQKDLAASAKSLLETQQALIQKDRELRSSQTEANKLRAEKTEYSVAQDASLESLLRSELETNKQELLAAQHALRESENRSIEAQEKLRLLRVELDANRRGITAPISLSTRETYTMALGDIENSQVIRSLQAELQTLRAQTETRAKEEEQTLIQAQQAMQEAALKLDEKDQQIQALNHELQVQCINAKKAEHALADQAQLVAELTTQLEAIIESKNNLEAKDADLQQTQAEAQNAQQELDKQAQLISELQAEVELLKTSTEGIGFEKVRKQLARAEAELADAVNEARERERDRFQAQSLFKKTETQLLETSAQLEQLLGSLTERESEISAKTALLSERDTNLAEQARILAEKDLALAEKEAALTALRAELQALRETHVEKSLFAEIQSSLNSKSAEHDHSKAEIQTLRLGLIQNEDVIHQLRGQQISTAEQLRSLQAELQDRETALTALRSEYANAGNEIEDLRKRLVATDRTLSASAVEKKRLSTALEESKKLASSSAKELQTLNQKLTEVATQQAERDSLYSRLEGDLHAAQGRNQELRLQWITAQEEVAELAQIRLSLASLKEEHQKVQSKLANATMGIHELRSQLELSETERTQLLLEKAHTNEERSQTNQQQKALELQFAEIQHSKQALWLTERACMLSDLDLLSTQLQEATDQAAEARQQQDQHQNLHNHLTTEHQQQLQRLHHEHQEQLQQLHGQRDSIQSELTALANLLTGVKSERELEQASNLIFKEEQQLKFAELQAERNQLSNSLEQLLAELALHQSRSETAAEETASLRDQHQFAFYSLNLEKRQLEEQLQALRVANTQVREEELTQLQKQVRELRGELENLHTVQTDFQAIQQSLTKKEALITETQQRLEESERNRLNLVDEYQSNITDARTEREELQSELTQSKDSIAHLHGELRLSQEKLAAWERLRQSMIDEQVRQLSSIESEKETMRQELTRMQEHVSRQTLESQETLQMRQEAEQLQLSLATEQQKLQHERQVWTQKVTELTAQLVTAQQQQESIENIRSSLIEKEQVSRLEAARFSVEREGLLRELDALRRANEDLALRANDYDTTALNAEYQVKEQHLRYSLEQKELALAVTNQELQQLKVKNHELSQALANAAVTAEIDLEKILREKDAEYQTAVAEYEEQINKLRATVSQQGQTSQKSDQQLGALEEQLRSALHELESLQQALEQKEQHLNLAKQQASKALEAEQWRLRYQVLQDEHRRTASGLDEATTRLEALESYILSVRDDVERMRSQRDRATAELQAVHNKAINQDHFLLTPAG